MNELSTLTCPKCGGEMRSYERNDVVVDQCTECRGIFLDRGELGEADGRGGQALLRRRPRGAPPDRDEQARKRKKSKKRSFLENLFEGE